MYFMILIRSIILFVCVFNSSGFAYKHFSMKRWGGKTENLESDDYERWFTQKLDHFNPNDERTWNQRYWINGEYASDERKVVFLHIGGEGESISWFMTNGAWVENAKAYNALLFQLEHRYYGQSRPTEDLSLENMVYLSSQQAITDMAFFIQAMNDEYKLPSDVKWIVFGGSYAGNLAAWVRQKYPYLVHGAMSASGPLLAKLDFSDYLKVVDNSLRTSNEQCPLVVKQAFDELETLLQTTDGRSFINTQYKLCDNIEESINNSLDISNFFEMLADNVAGVVQSYIGYTIDDYCNVLLNDTIGTPAERLAVTNYHIIVNEYYETCFNYKYSKMIEKLSNSSWDSEGAEGDRQWTYMVSTEFGYFQTSSQEPHSFGNRFNLSFFIQIGEDVFGPKYNQAFLERAINNTNTLYGGLDIEVTNTVFVHGSLDPWHVLGVTKTRSAKAPAILIEGANHCANMDNPSENDTPQMKAARQQIQELIGSWIDL